MLLRRSVLRLIRTNSLIGKTPSVQILHLAERNGGQRFLSSSSTSAASKDGSEGGGATKSDSKESISSCPAGTVLSGLNIYKDRADPVARPDSEYPDWLWTLLDSAKASSDGVVLESTEGLSKGQARIVEKRNIRAIRAAHRAKQVSAENAEKARAIAGSGAGMHSVGAASQGVVPDAAGGAEAKAADATTLQSVRIDERERKRELRAANRAGIKAKNFVKAR